MRPHADLPSRSPDHRPHRRWGSDRAIGRGDQGIGRERARRWLRQGGRGHDRGIGGRRAHPCHRRRAGHGRSRSSTFAAARHATSKIPDRDLDGDHDLRKGFRGGALPSISSVSRLPKFGAPVSRARRTGLKLVVEDRIKSAIEPCASSFRRLGRGVEFFRRHPGAAQVSQIRTGRGAGQRPTRSGAQRWLRCKLALCSRPTSARTRTGRRQAPGEAGFTERLRQALGETTLPTTGSFSRRAATARG